jgi:hypothetical protein
MAGLPGTPLGNAGGASILLLLRRLTRMNTDESGPTVTPPEEPAGRLIDFEEAVAISQMSFPPRPVLVVSGQKPLPTTEVSLVPLVYISQPQYWGIQVIGSVDAGGPRPTQPIANAWEYRVEIDLQGVTGTEGVEVIGASHTERLTIPTESDA